MKTAVQRWGNSLALRIPRAYAAETRICEGSEVEFTLKSGSLVIRPVTRKRHVLAKLLKRVTASNQHESVSTGASVGQEVW
ncbi:MAG TPA: AbrB/MazE/SpoVT family DNA-binding domain-containing protein [Verrucomicrobiae bacterium]